MKKLLLSMSALLFLLIVTASISPAADINITLTFENGKLVRTPPGPYTYTQGDRLVVANNAGFDMLVEVFDNGFVLHSQNLQNNGTVYIILNMGREKRVCYTYTLPEQKGEITVCDDLNRVILSVPSLSQWGLIVLGLLLVLTAAVWMMRRRKRRRETVA